MNIYFRFILPRALSLRNFGPITLQIRTFCSVVCTMGLVLWRSGAVRCTAVDACPLAGGETPEGDEAGGCGFVEGAVGIVGGEVLAVEGVRGCSAGDGGVTLVELEADGS